MKLTKLSSVLVLIKRESTHRLLIHFFIIVDTVWDDNTKTNDSMLCHRTVERDQYRNTVHNSVVRFFFLKPI